MVTDTRRTMGVEHPTLSPVIADLKEFEKNIISAAGKEIPIENISKDAAKAQKLERKITALQEKMYPEYMGVKEEDIASRIGLAARVAQLLEGILQELFTKMSPARILEDVKEMLSTTIRLKNAYELAGNSEASTRVESLEKEALEQRVRVLEERAQKSDQIRKRLGVFENWVGSQKENSWRDQPFVNWLFWTKKGAELEIAEMRVRLELEAFEGLSECPKKLTDQLQKLVQAQEALLVLMKPNSKEYQSLFRDIKDQKLLIQFGIENVLDRKENASRSLEEEKNLVNCAAILERVYQTALDPKRVKLAAQIETLPLGCGYLFLIQNAHKTIRLGGFLDGTMPFEMRWTQEGESEPKITMIKKNYPFCPHFLKIIVFKRSMKNGFVEGSVLSISK